MKLTPTKDKAWKQFSLYIRLKDAREGFVTCYTCGTTKFYKQMDAGHGISGRNNAVLFLEAVVKPQCPQCNRFKHGELHIFTRKLIEELGIKKYDELVLQSHQVVLYTVEDYLAIEEKYKALIPR
jgi:predicted metal-binding protein